MKWFSSLLFILALVLTWSLVSRFQESDPTGKTPKQEPVVAVEAARIEMGRISLYRTYSGALESTEKFILAPKVSGRVEVLDIDIGDTVRRGQVVARLDHAEYIQAVAQAEADLAVARANRIEAESHLAIAVRDLARVETLRKRGVSSESQLDETRARQLSAKAGLEIAGAQVARAESALETARIRLGYTKVTADWTGGDDQRVVAESFAAEGDTVSANTPLVSIVELDPITGVIFVTEKDYARLHPGLLAALSTDAFPGKTFSGKISRIAPVFRETTRQARVELVVDNPDLLLKPGMFIRVSVVLAEVNDAVIIPEAAITRRNDQTGVFILRESDQRALWKPVKTGIREGSRIQVWDLEPGGNVVTLGQQMLDNGTLIRIAEKTAPFSRKE